MRVFVSVDMEGVAGVATLDQIVRGGHGYPRAQQLMTAEANAAIRGALAAGADEVLVNDSHGTMDNLFADLLDRRARLLTGAPKPSCMMQGLDSGYDVALFVGYHAAAGEAGVLAPRSPRHLHAAGRRLRRQRAASGTSRGAHPALCRRGRARSDRRHHVVVLPRGARQSAVLCDRPSPLARGLAG